MTFAMMMITFIGVMRSPIVDHGLIDRVRGLIGEYTSGQEGNKLLHLVGDSSSSSSSNR